MYLCGLLATFCARRGRGGPLIFAIHREYETPGGTVVLRWRKSCRLAAALIVFVAITAVTPLAQARNLPGKPTPSAKFQLPISHPTLWLCRPGMLVNPCNGKLDATVIQPDGSQSVQHFTPNPKPPVDCFYIYPTAATSPNLLRMNAPLQRQPGPVAVTRAEVGRFASVCRLFVPVYRQRINLGFILPTPLADPAEKIADTDIDSAWHDYLDHYNGGRGVILIGHSQGATQELRLLHDEIQNSAAERHLLVAAYVLGVNALVPQGADVGGDLQNIPACRSTHQVGCIVAYDMYDAPPSESAPLGHAVNTRMNYVPTSDLPLMQDLCVNPAAPGGGQAPVTPVMPSGKLMTTLYGPLAKKVPVPSVSTDFIAYPGQVTAQCVTSGDASWLQINHPPLGPNAPYLNSAFGTIGGYPEWGLHLFDANAAQADLISLAKQEAASW